VTLTSLLRRHLRAADMPARLGGDEFVILMPGADADRAVTACRRLLASVREYPWARIAAGLAVTITVGVADGTGEPDPDEVLRHADAALYEGKRAGRDTVSRLPDTPIPF
jgi:diguanylate cyclase (GGDEF)-like protein